MTDTLRPPPGHQALDDDDQITGHDGAGGWPSPDQPPTTPGPPPAARERGPWRFLGGVVVGALVGAAVSGGIVAIADHNEASSPPVESSASVSNQTPTPAPTPTPTVDAQQHPIAAIVAAARPSVVAIHDSITQTDIFGRVAEGQAAGTGFVLGADGYIVTNDHVIDGATDITVAFSDGSTAAAQVVAADPNADLAVLKVDRTDLSPLPMGSSSDLQVGDQLIAIGNALDLSGGPTVTTGIVSATGRSLTEPNGVNLVNLIQTDTAINPGNSGGPLLNTSGQVVGINTAISSQAQNIGFAIAIDPAKAMIDQLRNGTVPQHPLLGVSTTAPSSGEGAQVVAVTNGSAAETAGISVGDVITAVDGDTIAGPTDLGAAIAAHQPGDQISVTYLRNGSSHTVDVTLGVRASAG